MSVEGKLKQQIYDLTYQINITESEIQPAPERNITNKTLCKKVLDFSLNPIFSSVESQSFSRRRHHQRRGPRC